MSIELAVAAAFAGKYITKLLLLLLLLFQNQLQRKKYKTSD